VDEARNTEATADAVVEVGRPVRSQRLIRMGGRLEGKQRAEKVNVVGIR
jgi:hypothetical protein